MKRVNPANWIPVDVEVHQEKPCLLMYGKNSMVLLERKSFPELKVRKLPFKFKARLFLYQGKMHIAKAWPDGDVLALYDSENFEKLNLSREDLSELGINERVGHQNLVQKINSFKSLKRNVLVQWVYQLGSKYVVLGVKNSLHCVYILDERGSVETLHEGIGEVFSGAASQDDVYFLISHPALECGLLRISHNGRMKLARLESEQLASQMTLKFQSVEAPLYNYKSFITGKGELRSYWKQYKGKLSTGKALVFVHGGPGAREGLRFRELFSLCLKNGIDVFVAHLPGCGGFSGPHFQRLDKRHGVLDTQSLLMGLETISSRFKITNFSLCGESYGGYVVLRALAQMEPEQKLIHNLINYYGVVQWKDLMEEIYQYDQESSQFDKFAHPVREAQKLQKMTVLDIQGALQTTSVLSLHGSKDRNVPLRHSQDLHMQLRTKSSAYHHLEVLDGEGHEILGYENRQICLQKVQDFWGKTEFLK